MGLLNLFKTEHYLTLITHLLRDRVSLSSLGWLISYGERAVAQALDTLERGDDDNNNQRSGVDKKRRK